MLLSCAIFLSGYFSVYPQETENAISFLSRHVWDKLSNVLTKEEAIMAMSIVAPEVSQYSQVRDELEINMLKIMYVQKGWGNFSIGPFQMKPRFAEILELGNKSLFNNSQKTEREKRYDRIKRLSDMEGQIKYLLLFIEAVRKKTAYVCFKTREEKLLYWATLYNGGLHLSNEQVKAYLNVKQFPRYGAQFNYAEISLEFYTHFKLAYLQK